MTPISTMTLSLLVARLLRLGRIIQLAFLWGVNLIYVFLDLIFDVFFRSVLSLFLYLTSVKIKVSTLWITSHGPSLDYFATTQCTKWFAVLRMWMTFLSHIVTVLRLFISVQKISTKSFVKINAPHIGGKNDCQVVSVCIYMPCDIADNSSISLMMAVFSIWLLPIVSQHHVSQRSISFIFFASLIDPLPVFESKCISLSHFREPVTVVYHVDSGSFGCLDSNGKCQTCFRGPCVHFRIDDIVAEVRVWVLRITNSFFLLIISLIQAPFKLAETFFGMNCTDFDMQTGSWIAKSMTKTLASDEVVQKFIECPPDRRNPIILKAEHGQSLFYWMSSW